MKKIALQVKERYCTAFGNKRFIVSFVVAVLFLFASLIGNFYAGIYATHNASNYVNDIVLDNIPVFNVDLSFVYGPALIWAVVILLCLHEPKRAPFVLKSIALFVIIRSGFITLTHIAPFPDHSAVDYTSDFIKKFTFGGDLFFSAHTGLPYLMALVFWEKPALRWFFILSAIYFGIIVLLGHLHYSIDVASAFFITYAIFHLSEFFFKKDQILFKE